MDKVIYLKEILEERGIKQKFIADKLSVSVSSVSLWVLGKTQPTIANLKTLAELLNVDVNLILFGKEEWR